MTYNDLSIRDKAQVIRMGVQAGLKSLSDIRSFYDNAINEYADGGSIHIDPSKKGTFTAVATKHGKSVQAFASQVLAHKENYSPAMVKKANFARNFGGHKKAGTIIGESSYLNIPAVTSGFEDWSKKYLGSDYSQYDYNIQDAKQHLENLQLPEVIKNEWDEMYAQQDLEHAIEEKQKILEKTRNDILSTPTGSAPGNWKKNVLYRIMTQGSGGHRDLKHVFAAIRQENANMPVFLHYTAGARPGDETSLNDLDFEKRSWSNTNRDLNKLYLFGDSTGFEQLPDSSRGFSYKNYLSKTGYTPKTYQGEIIPDEITIDPKYAPVIMTMLGKHTYTGAAMSPKEDDVARYIQKLGTDANGNLEIQASDIWDFYGGDWNKFWGDIKEHPVEGLISKIGAKILDKNGTPFILRDYAKLNFGQPQNDSYLDWLSDIPAYIGKDSSGVPIFELPEFTVTADGRKNDGKILKASMGNWRTDINRKDKNGNQEYTGGSDWFVEKKSTGGPLYPFSFSKVPLPRVRY